MVGFKKGSVWKSLSTGCFVSRLLPGFSHGRKRAHAVDSQCRVTFIVSEKPKGPRNRYLTPIVFRERHSLGGGFPLIH